MTAKLATSIPLMCFESALLHLTFWVLVAGFAVMQRKEVCA